MSGNTPTTPPNTLKGSRVPTAQQNQDAGWFHELEANGKKALDMMAERYPGNDPETGESRVRNFARAKSALEDAVVFARRGIIGGPNLPEAKWGMPELLAGKSEQAAEKTDASSAAEAGQKAQS